jgi:predicted Zn-dependent peptidase
LKREGVSAEGLDTARNYILGQYPLAFETAGDWAAALAELDLYGLPHSYIDGYVDELLRVDAARSREVINTEFPQPGDVDIVLIGDAEQIRSGAAQFGTVTEKSIDAPDFEAR